MKHYLTGDAVAIPAAVRPAGNFRWTICALLFFATTVNYLDRQVLSLLAPSLSKMYGWSNGDYADIAAAFQFVYAIALLFAGRIADWLGTRRAYALAITVWSFGAVLHAYSLELGAALQTILAPLGGTTLSVSVLGFMAARSVLAVGEAGNFPAAIRATAEYFPRGERSFATGIFNSGANIGAILAPLTVPAIAALWGWQAAFIWIGAIGFLWIAFWLVLFRDPAQQRRLSAAELAYIQGDDIPAPAGAAAPPGSWFALLRMRATWAYVVGKFMTDGVWWFYLFWLPKYLVEKYDMAASSLIVPLAVLYSMTTVASIAGGWLPTVFIRRGQDPFDSRMKAMLLIALFPLAVLLAQPLGGYGYWAPVLLIGIGASAHQAWSCNLMTISSDLFPRERVASVVGIGGLAGGIGGVVLTKIGGSLFDHYGALGRLQTGYMIMFTFCALAYLIAWAIMKWLIPSTTVPHTHKEFRHA